MNIIKRGGPKDYWDGQTIVCKHCKAQLYVDSNDLVYESGSDDLIIFCGDCDKETYRVNINEISPGQRQQIVDYAKSNREKRLGWLQNCALLCKELYYESPSVFIIKIVLFAAVIAAALIMEP